MKMKLVYLIIFVCLIAACKSGPFNLLKPSSPHQAYEKKIISAGLDQNTMGRAWIAKSNSLLRNAIEIKLPYKETGYFAAEKVDGAGFSFNLQRGQLLTAKLTKQSVNNFAIYMDIWEQKENGGFTVIAFADSLGIDLQLEVKKNGKYFLRLQPELLASGSYTLELSIGPSLAYPLKAVSKKQIQSFFGAGRDNNTRRHEGIDIFSKFRTPVLAIADGTVTRVNENNLGGKVVWLRPKGKDYSIYYAHLDKQVVSAGQEVITGDTLGLMGNTGNARTTPPHLHFGIYTTEGAVDPLPFVDPLILPLPAIHSNTSSLNATLRTLNKPVEISNNQKFINAENLKQNTIVRVLAATGNHYKIELPSGKVGYVNHTSLVQTKPLNTRKITNSNQQLLDYPKDGAGIRATLIIGQTVNLLGNFEDFQLVSTSNGAFGWLSLR